MTAARRKAARRYIAAVRAFERSMRVRSPRAGELSAEALWIGIAGGLFTGAEANRARGSVRS